MARRKLIRQNDFPYHITTRTNNKTWFSIPIFEVWDSCKISLVYAQSKQTAIIHCFVLMGNHYHLLISTPDSNIDEFMMFFNMKLSKLINQKSGVINHKFSNRYKWSIIDNEGYLLNAYRYIYQNPVRAKITTDCMSYPYSSLHFSRFESRQFNHKPHIYYKNEKSWIERNYGHDFDKVIQNSLNRRNFKVNPNTSTYHKRILSTPRNLTN